MQTEVNSNIYNLEDIRSNWKITKIKHSIDNYTNGAWGTEPQNNKDDVICIRIADFDYSKGILKNVDYTIRNIKLNRNITLEKGDLLIEKSGGGENQPVGRVIFYNKEFKSTFSNFITKIKIKDNFDSKFIYYVFRTLYNLRINTKSIKQTTGIQNLDSYAYFNETIIVPPFNDQKQIAKYLDTKTTKIEQTITKNKKLITLLKEKRTSLINQTVTKGLNPEAPMKESGIKWIGKIPEHWKTIKISSIFNNISSGTTPKSSNDEYYLDGTENWLITGDLNDNYIFETSKKITLKAMNDYSILKKYPINSLVIAMYGATIGKLGILKINASTNQACCVLSNPYNTEIKYVFYWFLAYRNEIISLSYGGGQPNISQDIIKNIKITFPPIKEQKEIIKYLDDKTSKIDKTIEKIERNIELLEEYKESLIHHVVTGKIDVRGVEL